MGGIFSHDGPLFKVGNAITDILLLGMLWFFASIPLVTMGAATTAAYYVATKNANGMDVRLWRDFWKSFRQNFITSTLVFLTLAAVYTIFFFNMRNIDLVENMRNIVFLVQILFLIQTTFVAMYAFPIISRFDLRYIQIFKTAFFLANRHILITLINSVLLAVMFTLAWDIMPALLLVAMGIYCHFSSLLIVKVFRKYRPDLDPPDVNGGEHNEA
ncbi:MAG: DUF624 domain-containing protein [Defluviitaleaceae bacterium]|nr:DUF624 domain-containing protein [Defluviitaleaceae bacterium]